MGRSFFVPLILAHLHPQKGDQVDGLFSGDDCTPQVLDG